MERSGFPEIQEFREIVPHSRNNCCFRNGAKRISQSIVSGMEQSGFPKTQSIVSGIEQSGFPNPLFREWSEADFPKHSPFHKIGGLIGRIPDSPL